MTTNRRVAVPALDNLRAFVAGVSGTHVLTVEGVSGVTAQKLLWLKESGRDFLSLDESDVRGAIQSYLKAALARADKKPGAVTDVFKAMAQGAKQQILMVRFKRGWGRPLAPSTIESKRRRGARFPALQGLDTEQMYNGLARAKWSFVKVSGT